MFWTGVIVLASLVPSSPDGAKVLNDMDAAMNAYEDLKLSYDMIDKQAGRDARTLGMEVAIKGDMRVTEFTAPADMKGTKILVKSTTQMYVYVPAYRKVRRIASHVTNQGFMGTAYSSDDLALNRFADKYVAKVIGQDDKTWKLEATAKNDDAPYPRITIIVDKKMYQPIRLEFFDDGKHIKTETRSGFTCEGKVCVPGKLEMVDHRSNDHSSTLVRKSYSINPGLPSRVFTKRNLQRSR